MTVNPSFEQRAFAPQLKKAGYTTAYFGKVSLAGANAGAAAAPAADRVLVLSRF